jgi:SNF family Na+-dependent transporter
VNSAEAIIMGKSKKSKMQDNTFYFPGQKSKSDNTSGAAGGSNEEEEEEEEDEDEMQDNFIEFGAGKNIPEIILPQPLDDDQEMEMGMTDLEGERGQWGNKLDFLFSCISVSVGLGNVWRFPYLCYKNGGGAFLIVYFIAMTFCGIPIFFQEVAIGQYLGSGGMTLVAQLCPILKGVGIATMVLVFFLDIYYCVIIAWTFFYLIATFTAIPGLPWDTCEGWWNTKYCYRASDNLTENTENIAHHNQTIFHGHNKTTTPVEEFWEHRVLQQNAGLEFGLGSIQWELVGCLLLAWILVYLIIWKGLHSSGKVCLDKAR